jgi:AcrR family transcriptional regulator
MMQEAAEVSEQARKPREQAAQDTRQRLLAAAERTFVDHGYAASTLDRIAAAAGFTKGAVYWHFPTKQALFLALLKERHGANAEKLDAIFTDCLTLRSAAKAAAVKAAFGRYILSFESTDVLPLLAMELEMEARRDPSLRAEHARLVTAYEDRFAAVLERFHRETGHVPAIPLDQMATTIITMVKGFALARQNRPERAASLTWLIGRLLGLPEKA